MLKEVIYLNESDRPKKERPLEFTEWQSEINGGRAIYGDEETLNRQAKEYAAYLSNFNPEVKQVEFTHVLAKTKGYMKDTGDMIASNVDSITYLGKCITDGDMFSVKYKVGGIQIFKGHLNSGFYSVE